MLDLKYYGDPVLRKVSEPVENVDGRIVKFAEDLIETMGAKNGIGLAANQVGEALRIFAVDPSLANPGEKPFVLINPRIITTEGDVGYEEGCLSFPGLFERVQRPEKVLVEALDIEGNSIRTERDGLVARIILHENDHLDGKLFIDYFSFLRKQMYNNKLKRLKAGEIEVFR